LVGRGEGGTGVVIGEGTVKGETAAGISGCACIGIKEGDVTTIGGGRGEGAPIDARSGAGVGAGGGVTAIIMGASIVVIGEALTTVVGVV